MHKRVGKLRTLVEEVTSYLEDEETVDTTVPSDVDHPVRVVEPPVDSNPVGDVQALEFDHIPIDDDDYVPDDAKELGRAMRLLFDDVPQETVAWLWRNMKRLKDKAATETTEEQGRDGMQNEAKIRQLIRAMLIEQGARDSDEPSDEELAALERGEGLDDDEPEQKKSGKWGDEPMAVMGLSDDDADLLRSLAAQAAAGEAIDSDMGVYLPDDEEDETGQKKKYVTVGDEGATWADIAGEEGLAGPSGAKNIYYKAIVASMYSRWLEDEHTEEYTDTMEEFALEYVDALREAFEEDGGLSDEEQKFLDHLEETPEDLYDDPNFRYFLNKEPGVLRYKMKNDSRFHDWLYGLFKQGNLEKAHLLAAGLKEKDFPEDVKEKLTSAKEKPAKSAKKEKSPKKGKKVTKKESVANLKRVMTDKARYSKLLENSKFVRQMMPAVKLYVRSLTEASSDEDRRFLTSLNEADLVSLMSHEGFKSWAIETLDG